MQYFESCFAFDFFTCLILLRIYIHIRLYIIVFFLFIFCTSYLLYLCDKLLSFLLIQFNVCYFILFELNYFGMNDFLVLKTDSTKGKTRVRENSFVPLEVSGKQNGASGVSPTTD